MAKKLLIIGGVLNAVLALFHMLFWKLFNWPESLRTISADNQAIMQVLAIHGTYVVALFAVLSLVFTRDLLMTRLGRIITLSIAGFYYLRCLNEFIFWDITDPGALIIFILCLLIAVLYSIPLRMRPVEDD
jgi:hypothetical protein